MKHATRFTVQRGWKLLLADMGVRPGDVLTLAGLPADLFSRADATLTPAEYFQLWRGLEAAINDECLPLLIGQHLSTESFDPPIFAALCSRDMNQALQRLQAYKLLMGPWALDLEVDAQHTTATFHCYGHDGALPRSLCATELVFLTKLIRLATRQHLSPSAVELQQPPDDPTPFEAYFGVPLRTGELNQIRFTADDARRPFLTEDAAMWGFFEAGLQQRLSDLKDGASIVERVRGALLNMLPSGQVSIDQAAERLAMSKRSLQRHLTDAATGYQEVLNATRLDLAQHYLTRSALSLGEISYLLGFQDSNSFQRAFKGWTLETPSAYRLLSNR